MNDINMHVPQQPLINTNQNINQNYQVPQNNTANQPQNYQNQGHDPFLD